MVTETEVLAIVMARGGSKGMPGKNIALLQGHPLIAYSISAGLAAASVTRLIVSTDNEDIAEISRQYGAEIPFMRPAELATDEALDYPVIEHALNWLEQHENYYPDLVIQLRPTTPLRSKGMIDASVAVMLKDTEADCVRGVTRATQTPYKMWKMGNGKYLEPLVPTTYKEPYNMPRQQLPVCFWQTGHIDVIRRDTIVNKKSLTGDKIIPMFIEQEYCVDIDTARGLREAERALSDFCLEIDCPETPKRRLPDKISLLIFDFDGVFTDNRVLVMEDGKEAVICDRGDGMGLSKLQMHGIDAVILSTEKNPVVTVRAKKLGMEVYQGVDDKLGALRMLCDDRNVALENVIYVGNDINDLACMRSVGFSVAVADAYPEVKIQADIILERRGGEGAVREICDVIIKQVTNR